MPDEPTQEQVREAVTELANALASPSMQTVLQSFAGLEEGRPPIPATVVETAHLRTLLAAYTRMEADLLEARRLMKPAIALVARADAARAGSGERGAYRLYYSRPPRPRRLPQQGECR